MRYLHCFAVVTSFVVQNNNQLENSLTETLTTMVSLSLQMCLEQKLIRFQIAQSDLLNRTANQISPSVEL